MMVAHDGFTLISTGPAARLYRAFDEQRSHFRVHQRVLPGNGPFLTPPMVRGSLAAEEGIHNNMLIERRRAEILQIAAAHGARNIRVFGLTARGEAQAASDLDLLITLEPGRGLLDLVAIKQDLEDLLGCNVDVITDASLSPYLREGAHAKKTSPIYRPNFPKHRLCPHWKEWG